MNRLDVEMVERGLAPSRAKAQELIKTGKVQVNNIVVTKSGSQISKEDNILILDHTILKYVSRAGLKLEKAINVFHINFKQKNVMDIGSSTGGFTDCALKNGASHIICIDVGTDLLHPSLRNDSRITLLEQTNIKDVPHKFFKDIDIFVIDVSFVSLKVIFEKLHHEQASSMIMALIKPQFECGKQIATKYKGIILDKNIHREVINNVISFAGEYGYHLQSLAPSAIRGGDGNIEYISLWNNSQENSNINIEQIITEAFEK